jgi:hypothetical protein
MSAKTGFWSAAGALAGGALGAMAGKYATPARSRQRVGAVLVGGAAGGTLGAFVGGALAGPSRGPVVAGALSDEWGGATPPVLPQANTSTEV